MTLNDAPGEPISLAVLPDGRVLHTTRDGTVFLHDPASGENSVAAEISVYTHDEEGLHGIAVGPDFESDGWVYLYYSPRLDTPVDDPSTEDSDEGAAPLSAASSEAWAAFEGVTRLSRFRLEGGRLLLDGEQILLEVPSSRGICCHLGGDLDFDAEGRLYLSTGDDTNPFLSNGYSPLDERARQHPALDAQRTAANTNDLRGKLLRLEVGADGSVTSPAGNLFPASPNTRSEIYAMGLRNPYRIAAGPDGAVYVADYAPDARAESPERGPEALGHWTAIREPGNLGWPYCRGERPYVDYDFATERSSAPFDCDAPLNESPNGDGLRELPAVAPPLLAYSNVRSAEWPELGSGGIGPMAGPAYEFRRGASDVAWPEHYAGRPLLYEWVRDFIALIDLDDDGNPVGLERLPFATDNPIDLEFGPDGALYVLEYGDGYFRANREARLLRIEYVGDDEG